MSIQVSLAPNADFYLIDSNSNVYSSSLQCTLHAYLFGTSMSVCALGRLEAQRATVKFTPEHSHCAKTRRNLIWEPSQAGPP